MSGPDLVAIQAAAFLDLFEREGGEWRPAFRRWATSKDFSPAVRRSIAAVVGLDIQARGTFADPLVMLDFAPVEE